MTLRLLPLLILCLALNARAHDGLEVEPPTSDQEAWNTITLCRANIETLLATQQWLEIPIQVSFCTQSLRYLREHAGPARANLVPKFYEVEQEALDLFGAATRNDGVRTAREVRSFGPMLDELARAYPPAIVQAIVYSCPMCRGVHELDAAKSCFKCGMALVPRIIPASSVYNTPGEPSIALTATIEAPMEVGKESLVKVCLKRKKDGVPVNPADLLVVHTQRIHLLIIDATLTDYHHEHPAPTGQPGEYSFTLQPRLPGPYRVFADVVPAGSNVQEYAVGELPGRGAAERPQPKANQARSENGDLRFDLTWDPAAPLIRARQPARGTIHVTEIASGAEFRALEPIMGTFAHVVAFHEDGQTVLHIHPLGTVPQSVADRGGPVFTFQFYAPKAGCYHLFGQVQVNGESRFAPFMINVAE